MKVVMVSLDEEYQHFDKDALPADTRVRVHIGVGLVQPHHTGRR